MSTTQYREILAVTKLTTAIILEPVQQQRIVGYSNMLASMISALVWPIFCLNSQRREDSTKDCKNVGSLSPVQSLI
jgi:hypothetical protein